MATSSFSASLRALPAFITGKAPAPVTPPAVQMPTLPKLPDVPRLAEAPNALNRDLLNKQLTNLPAKYAPLLTQQRTAAQQALAGLGGWQWQQDNPNTPEREDLAVPTKDPNAALGARETMAVWEQRYAANARGLLHSSFANKAVGNALARLNEEAKATVNAYASNINQILAQQRQDTTDIIGELVNLYGQDARWAAENPPPPPPDWMAPPGTIGDVWAGYHWPDPDELAAMYPGMEFTYRQEPDGRVVATARPRMGSGEPPGGKVGVNVEPMGRMVGGGAAAQTQRWVGDSKPNLKTLAKAWGIPESRIAVVRAGNGKWVAVPKALLGGVAK